MLVGGVWPLVAARDVDWTQLRGRHWVRLQIRREGPVVEVVPKACIGRSGYWIGVVIAMTVLASAGRSLAGHWEVWRGPWLAASALAIVAWMAIWGVYEWQSRLQRAQSGLGAIVRLDAAGRVLCMPRVGREVSLSRIRRVAVHAFLASPDDEEGVYLVHRLRLMVEDQGIAGVVDVMDASGPFARRVVGRMAAEITRAAGTEVQGVRQSGKLMPGRRATKAPPAYPANPK